jgi:hypothetical protein
MVSFGSLFRLIKSHLGLVSVSETSKSLLGRSPFGLVGLLLVSSCWSHLLGDHIGLMRSPFVGLANDETQKRPKETKMHETQANETVETRKRPKGDLFTTSGGLVAKTAGIVKLLISKGSSIMRACFTIDSILRFATIVKEHR